QGFQAKPKVTIQRAPTVTGGHSRLHELGADRLEVLRGASERPTGFKPPHHIQPLQVAAIERGRVAEVKYGTRTQGQGQVECRSDFGSGESGGSDTDDFERVVLND